MAQLYDANGNPAFTDVLAQNQAVGSLNAAVTTQLRGQSTVVVQVLTIGSQTLIFEGTVDGTNFFSVNMFPVAGGAPVTTTTANGQWIGVVAGMYQFRTRCSVYVSGSATVSQNAAQGTNEQTVSVGSAQNAASAGQNAVLVEGAVTTAPPAYTTGNASALSLSVPGGLRVGEPQNTASAGLPAPLVMGAVLTAAPAYTTANASALSLTTAGGLRTDMSSQGATAITSVPVAAGTGTLTGNAPVVNAALFVGTTASVASSAGVQKVGVSGATGVTLDAASGGAFPTNMVAIAGKAQNVNPTAVANATTVAIATDLAGRVIITPLAYRTLFSHQATASAATAETTIITAGAAGVFRDLVSITITTAAILASAITIRDVTAGGTPWIINYPNAAAAPGAPFVIVFGATPLRQGTAASAWTFAQTVANALNFTCQYVERIA